MCTRALLLALAVQAVPAAVTVRFEPLDPQVGPFPSDAVTVADPAQKTGHRVNLPLPDCTAAASPCRAINLVNQLDGFNLRPRVSVRFSGPIHPDTLRDGVFVMALENLTAEEYGLFRTGQINTIDQVVYDPATNTAYAKTDSILDQHRRYLLFVTDGVRERSGAPVAADPAFSACIAQPANEYCAALSQAVAAASLQAAPRRVVSASIFTTLSATAWLEKARAQLENLAPASRLATNRSVFRAADLTAITWRRQVGTVPPRLGDITVDLNPAVQSVLLAGVGRVAFGSYLSYRWLNDAQSIGLPPTAADVAAPAAELIQYTAYLPETARPASGYPVVIFGHGLGDSRLGGPTAVASSFAQAGFATLAINAVGHGYGPQSSIILTDRGGTSAEIPGGGRGVDVNGDGAIQAFEGCIIGVENGAMRDCLRQTALDLAQLTRAIRGGLDVDGDGTPDFDADRIYYAGQSLGALYGTVFNAIEPGTRAAALNVGGGTVMDIGRWSPTYRALVGTLIGTPLDDNSVLRYQPAKVLDAPGAIALQNLLELYEWMVIPGDPTAYAPHLRSSTLPNVPIKPVLWQVAKGDRTVPNPASSNLIRAANMRETTWLYRHDVARAIAPGLPANPHTFLVLFANLDEGGLDFASLQGLAISLQAQGQIAGFFRSGGAAIPNPNSAALRLLFLGRELFEVPDALPEDLNF
ncbi:MAG: alpha/beta hydrolase family protein [Bryobacteraceae bacterium]